MDPVDTEVRAALVRAAERAPCFAGIQQTKRRHRWVRRGLVLGTAMAVTVFGGTWWLIVSQEPASFGQCPAMLEFQGRTYRGHGEPLRIPRLRDSLGTAVHPGCAEFGPYTSEVHRLPGVRPEAAVWSQGRMWIAEGIVEPPAEVRTIEEPVRCTSVGTSDVVGDLVSIPPRPGSYHVELAKPYVAVIVADQGEFLPLDQYVAVTIEVRVTPDTRGGKDPRIVSDALQGPTPLHVAVHCEDGRFMADAISLGG